MLTVSRQTSLEEVLMTLVKRYAILGSRVKGRDIKDQVWLGWMEFLPKKSNYMWVQCDIPKYNTKCFPW